MRHLHDFAREVGLSEREWEAGIRFLTEVGHITDERRQEFILLSDTLGLSMLVTAMAHRVSLKAAPKPRFSGRFSSTMRPSIATATTWPTARAANRASCRAWCARRDGEPASGAHASKSGRRTPMVSTMSSTATPTRTARAACCIVFPMGAITFARSSRCPTRFRTMVRWGECSKRWGAIRGALRICISMITAPGLNGSSRTLFTRRLDRYLDSDAVFGVRSSLIAQWIHHESMATAPDGFATTDALQHLLDSDFVAEC